MRRSWWGAAALLVLLAGCGGDPKADPSPTPSETPVSPTPSPTAPTMPAAAAENSKAGAIAFVRYYIELINHLQRTGDSAPLRQAALPTCKSCKSVIRAAEGIYATGGHVEGGAWSITDITATQPTSTLWQVDIKGRLAPSKVLNGPASVPTAGKGGQANAEFFLTFSSTWKVAQWHTG